MKRRISRRRRIINKARGMGKHRLRGGSASMTAIARFIEEAKQAQREQSDSKTEAGRSFAELELHHQLAVNLESLGFRELTPIQDQTFEQIMAGNDVLGIANTGTGKTGAFLIPAVQMLVANEANKMLIVAPTRELAIQINKQFMALTHNLGLYSIQTIGGTNISRQMQNLKRKHELLVGTPGRIVDLVKRGCLDLTEFNLTVLDEVDRMLDMGFVRDIKFILSKTNQRRQSLYFSATTTDRVIRLIKELSAKVISISVKTAVVTQTVEHDIIRYKQTGRKMDMLHDILIEAEVHKTLIFGRTKRGVNRLMRDLRERGFKVDAIHGNKSQAARQRALQAFRDDRVSILVATDVAARGLDIEDVSHVINYDAPESFDDYIHRTGRTGRAGKRGKAYTFVQ